MFKLLSVSNRCAFISEGGSADYIVTGAWSAKAVKEVKYKKRRYGDVLPSSFALVLIMYLTKQPQGSYWENVLQIPLTKDLPGEFEQNLLRKRFIVVKET